VSTSKLKNELRERKQSESSSSSHLSFGSKSSVSSGRDLPFSSQKYSVSNSPASLKPVSYLKSNYSYYGESGMREGGLIDAGQYLHLFGELSEERTKKACLRTKSLIARNELYEIGCMVKRGQQSVKLYVYFTPFQTVTDFLFSISK
jgi:hypothetical protein